MVAGLCQTLDEAMTQSEFDDFTVAVLDFRLGRETRSCPSRAV